MELEKISAMIKPNNVIMGVNIMDTLKAADLGDVPIIPRIYKREVMKQLKRVFLKF